MPKNPLQLVFLIVISNLVPRRTVGSELTSCFAASMATFATLPMVELNVKIAPTCTTAGLEETLLVAPLVLEKRQKKSGNRANIMSMQRLLLLKAETHRNFSEQGR